MPSIVVLGTQNIESQDEIFKTYHQNIAARNIAMLNQWNPYAKIFRHAGEFLYTSSKHYNIQQFICTFWPHTPLLSKRWMSNLLPIQKQTPHGLIKYTFLDFENLCFNPNYSMDQAYFAPKDEDSVDDIN